MIDIAVPATSSVVVPTAVNTVFPTPGVYTIPSTTITVLESVTVCEAVSTQVPQGVHTVGGVVTVVKQATTVVCPYAQMTEVAGKVTSTLLTTTYVCPSAGTYTIAPITTSVPAATIIVYATAASYTPGTYVRKEAVVTVTETNYQYVCPFTQPAPVFVPATQAVTPVKETPAPAAKVVETPKQVAKVASNGALGVAGDQWAITYTPFDTQGGCKSAEAVMADIKIIASKGFTTVRIYGTDKGCSGLINISAAVRACGLKMIVGVFIDASGVAGAQSQVAEIAAWAQWDIVELIVCGNEAVWGSRISAVELVAFIRSSREAFAAKGYHGMVTTTETVDVWQNNAHILCDAVDVVAFNAHPFFNPATTAAGAGAFVEGQFAIMNALCPGKAESYNMECGWPNGGECNGAACGGVEQQAIAIAGIRSAVGGKTVMFSFQNDGWKPAIDQHWGVMGCY